MMFSAHQHSSTFGGIVGDGGPNYIKMIKLVHPDPAVPGITRLVTRLTSVRFGVNKSAGEAACSRLSRGLPGPERARAAQTWRRPTMNRYQASQGRPASLNGVRRRASSNRLRRSSYREDSNLPSQGPRRPRIHLATKHMPDTFAMAHFLAQEIALKKMTPERRITGDSRFEDHSCYRGD
jgi:hypothetical protein